MMGGGLSVTQRICQKQSGDITPKHGVIDSWIAETLYIMTYLNI